VNLEFTKLGAKGMELRNGEGFELRDSTSGQWVKAAAKLSSQTMLAIISYRLIPNVLASFLASFSFFSFFFLISCWMPSRRAYQ
jgi:hypothetical protein